MKFKIFFLIVSLCVWSAENVQADLVGYQNLDSATGLTFGPPSTGTNDGAIVAGGLFGSALSLDGAGDFASVDDVTGLAGNLGTGAKTASVWFNQNTGTTGLRSAMTIGANGNGTKFDLDIDNGNTGLELGVGGGRTTDTGATLGNGAWHHMLVTHAAGAQAGQVSIFFDGASRATGGNTRPIDTGDTRWLFGTAANIAVDTFPNAQFFNGLVDDGAIWNEEFTVEEVTALGFVGSSSLGYTADLFDSLKQVHDAGSGSVVVGATNWTFATGIAGNTTTSVIFGAGGSGVVATAVPEPGGVAVLISLAFLFGAKRRRR